jgi:hypothetical protein
MQYADKLHSAHNVTMQSDQSDATLVQLRCIEDKSRPMEMIQVLYSLCRWSIHDQAVLVDSHTINAQPKKLRANQLTNYQVGFG